MSFQIHFFLDLPVETLPGDQLQLEPDPLEGHFPFRSFGLNFELQFRNLVEDISQLRPTEVQRTQKNVKMYSPQ